MKQFKTIAISYTAEHKVAAITRAYADATKGVTKMTLDNGAYLTIPNASMARLALLKPGKRVAYDTSSSTITEDETGRRYTLDRAATVILLNDINA